MSAQEPPSVGVDPHWFAIASAAASCGREAERLESSAEPAPALAVKLLRQAARRLNTDAVDPIAHVLSVVAWCDEQAAAVASEVGGHLAAAALIELADRLRDAMPGSEIGGESVSQRQDRRLRRLRDLGADLRQEAGRWKVHGTRGALNALAREEKSAGRPFAGRPDVKRDLEKAAARARSGR